MTQGGGQEITGGAAPVEAEGGRSRRILREIWKILRDELIKHALSFIVPIGAVEAFVLHRVDNTVSFGAGFLYCAPLTLAAAVVTAMILEEVDFGGGVFVAALVLWGAARVQNGFAHGHHFAVKPCTETVGTISLSCEPHVTINPVTWFLKALFVIFDVLDAYWSAFGQGTFFACVIVGAAVTVYVRKRLAVKSAAA